MDSFGDVLGHHGEVPVGNRIFEVGSQSDDWHNCQRKGDWERASSCLLSDRHISVFQFDTGLTPYERKRRHLKRLRITHSQEVAKLRFELSPLCACVYVSPLRQRYHHPSCGSQCLKISLSPLPA